MNNDILRILHRARRQVIDDGYDGPAYALLENIIDSQIGVWPPTSPVSYVLTERHAMNALHWRLATGYWELDLPEQPAYCTPCDIEHDQPQDCPSHDDYEPVRGLDRYPEVKASDLADND